MLSFVAQSKIMMSISQFWLAGTFAMERFNTKRWLEFLRTNPLWKCIILVFPYSVSLFFISIYKGLGTFIRNRPAMIFSSILLLHFAGLFFTTDFDYAAKDIRTKLPLFLLPLFISTSSAFNRRYFYGFLLLYAASVLVRTVINTFILTGGHFVDIRQISRPISHLIVALHVSMVIFILGYFLMRKVTFPVVLKFLFGLCLAWFLFYLILVRSSTGIVITGLTILILSLVFIFRSPNFKLKISLTAFIFIFFGSTGIYIGRIIHDYYKVNPVDFSKLDQVSARGNRYFHDTASRETENGNLLYIYIQVDEMKEAWEKRSSVPYNGHDKRNQEITNTLTRFLTSKGFRKDAAGVNKLSDKEIRAIEKGVTDVVFTQRLSIRGPVYDLLAGYGRYKASGDPTGSSLMQRIEFWKSSLGLIREHWLTGVGTGDMNEAFQAEYVKMNSKLAPDQRWRSHNQFLSIFVGFGIFGLLWFLFAILYPPIVLGKFRDYFFLVFFIIAMLSMMPEDTIESQAGVTFFALFYSLFLFARKEEDNI